MPATPKFARGLYSYVLKARWAIIAWIVVFWRLGYPSLMDPDEAHYAELTREMVRAGNWLVPRLDGQPYIDKPVLFHWLQGLSFTALGETEFAARLPIALAALALIWITRRIGRTLFDETTGDWASIMFATIPATFALASVAIMDMLFAMFLFGGLACLLAAGCRRQLWLEVAGYALLALAVMTKGPVALLLVALFCATAWFAGGELREWTRALHWKTGLPAAALLASPWFVWMYLRYGDAFVQGYVLAGNLYYFTQPESFSGRAISHLFYLRVFAGGFFPWSAICVGRGVDLALRRGARMTAAEKLLWLWTAVVVLFFSAARFKLDHYIFPAAPAICLIAAKAWRDVAADDGLRMSAIRAVVLGLGGLLVVAGTFVSVYIFELNLELPPSAIALPMVLAAGGVVTLTAAARSGWRLPAQPIVPVLTLLSVYALVVTIGFPTLERTRPTALVAKTLRQTTPAGAPTGIYRLENWRASLRFYADRPLAGLSTPEDVRALARANRPIYLLMRRRDLRALQRGGIRLREMFRCRAVVGTTHGTGGLRRQQWGELLIVTNAPRSRFRP